MTDGGVSGIALVTGANRGLGLEVARQLGKRDYRVLLACRDGEKAVAAARQLSSEGILSLAAHELDLASDTSIDQFVEALIDEFDGENESLDVLVNNAGVHYDTWQTATTADFDIVDEAWRTNARGAWRLAARLAPLLRRAAHARIVNVSSGAGSLESMSGGTPAYSVSKAAMNAVTRILAGELERDGVLVNSVCPGWVATDMGGGGRPIPEGAAGIVWAATLPPGGPTGGFFRDGEPVAW